MLTYTISKEDRKLSGEISLTPSKSISNRDIVIRALKNARFDIKNVTEKDAAKVVDESIRKGKITLDRGEPAMAIRFLRAFLTYFKGDWIVTGSAEMRKRPIGDVIEILNKEGINIKYIERDGYPPLKIIGKGIRGNINRVDAVICSQFINTALLISPTLPADHLVDLKNSILNSPYISQTIRLIRYLGINKDWNSDEILFENELHNASEMTVEADWLSASYWYQMAAFAQSVDFKINGLNPDSVQSDAIVKELFEPLGVKTRDTGGGVELTMIKRKIDSLVYDFSNNLDLIPTMVVTCVGLGVPFSFSGIEIMNVKNPQRLMALKTQLIKLGANLIVEKKGEFETLHFDGKTRIIQKKAIEFNVLGDHRVAMALAPLSILGITVSIENPRVVSKSYPCYWEDYKRVGYNIDQPVLV
jgi:3-phosphoshikimate 1-carboxyvinyltransferase